MVLSSRNDTPKKLFSHGLEEEQNPPRESKSYPSKLFVEVTTRCNLRCGMCVKQTSDSELLEGNISPETFCALEPSFPYLTALILNGIGEPLLHPHLEEFIRKARKQLPDDAWVGFQTNGILLNKERALSLVEAGLSRICLSMDAVSQGTFRTIREGGEVRDLESAFSALNAAVKSAHGHTRRRLDIGIEFVLMRENLFELPKTVRWAAHRGATFALVTQVLPYAQSVTSQAVYDTNTRGAISVYDFWKDKAGLQGLDIRRYFDVFMKYFKNTDEEKICALIEGMKADAGSQGIALHLERLLMRDEEWLKRVKEIFEETLKIGQEEGIEIRLPEVAPRNNRKCEFVEGESSFVSWEGDVHPCYFLWHRYSCYVGGWEKQIKPWSFGNLKERNILDIWNDRNYRSFREGVLRYDFPFCFDCSFALCDYVQGEDFEQDCYVSSVPCGACLWCTGLFHCLQ
jgi:putative metalloenzyme radical SAM/SPASM domain maturase